MTARQLPNGLWEVESERDESKSYFVSLEPGAETCTCPHWQIRLAGTGALCKHQMTAQLLEAQEKVRARFLTASRVPDAILPVLLEKHADDAVVVTVLLFERERRARADRENEERLALFR